MILETRNLTKIYEIKNRSKKKFADNTSRKIRCEALKSINFNIQKGEIIGLIGPNGAGKSTFIKLITGILAPSSGEVKLFGENPLFNRKRNAYRLGVMMGQRSQLWWDLPAKHSFELYKRMYGIDDKSYLTKISSLVDMLDIDHILDIPVRKLSLGQRIRCELCVALIHSPEFLFLDEPTIGVDIVVKEKVLDFIKNLNEQYNTTILLTTHDIVDIEKSVERVAVINQGELIFNNDINKLKQINGNYQIIHVKINRKKTFTTSLPRECIQVIDTNNYAVRLDLDKYKLSNIIQEIITNNEVIDISIEKDSIENVVKQLYLKGGEIY